MGKAEIRMERMAIARAKLEAKIASGHPRAEAAKARIADYDLAMEEEKLQSQLDALKAKRQGDVTVSPGTASLAGGGN